jgi:hypothetical protein
MPAALIPHRAGYALARPDGSDAGTETVEVAPGAGGWRIQTHIETWWPDEITSTVDWDLDGKLVTRLLHIVSSERVTGETELEVTVTGNGLLAHRRGPDGPTQVELGWGPNAELDYISAAFPTVMLARSGLAPGASRKVDAVQIGTLDLVPTIVGQVLHRRAPAAGEREEPASSVPGVAVGQWVEFTVVETGFTSMATATADGVLAGYGRLLRLTWVETSK